MSYFHKKKLTNGQKWRSAIIIVEILVLFLAIFVSRFTVNTSAVESVVQVASNELVSEANTAALSNTEVEQKTVTFYVDSHNGIRFEGSEIVYHFNHLQGCPLDIIKFQEDESGSISSDNSFSSISLATASRGVTVHTAGYKIVVMHRAVILRTIDNGSYRIQKNCD
jgi:hypothetical protein